jgi:hypothetical protein
MDFGIILPILIQLLLAQITKNYVNQKIKILKKTVSRVTLVLFARLVMFMGKFGMIDIFR